MSRETQVKAKVKAIEIESIIEIRLDKLLSYLENYSFNVLGSDFAKTYPSILAHMQLTMEKMGRFDATAYLISYIFAVKDLVDVRDTSMNANLAYVFDIELKTLNRTEWAFLECEEIDYRISHGSEQHNEIASEDLIEIEAEERRMIEAKAKELVATKGIELSAAEAEVKKLMDTEAKELATAAEAKSNELVKTKVQELKNTVLTDSISSLIEATNAYVTYIADKDGEDWEERKKTLNGFLEILQDGKNLPEKRLQDFYDAFNAKKSIMTTNPDPHTNAWLRSVAYVIASVATLGIFNLARIAYRACSGNEYVSFGKTFSGVKFADKVDQHQPKPNLSR